MKKKIFIILLIGMLLLLATWLVSNKGWGTANKENFYSGTIEATFIPIQAEATGKIIELTMDEGARVKVGDKIAKIDERAARIAIATAQSQLSQAEQRLADLIGGTRAQELRKLQANVEQARAGLEQIKANQQQLQSVSNKDLETLQYEEKLLKDSEALYQEAAITKRELDAQMHKRNLAQAQYESSKAQLEVIKAQGKSANAQLASSRSTLDLAVEGYTQPTILAQKAVVEGARQAVKLAELNLDKTLITSPVEGIMQYKHVELGQVVSVGSKIATVMDPKDIWIKVYVPEAQLNKVKLGQKASIEVDAYPHKKFSGEVINISENAEFTPKNVQTKEERTTIVFAVKVKLSEGFSVLKAGMPADVIFK